MKIEIENGDLDVIVKCLGATESGDDRDVSRIDRARARELMYTIRTLYYKTTGKVTIEAT